MHWMTWFFSVSTQLATANGVHWRQGILLEVNITDSSGVLKTTWALMCFFVTPGLSSGNLRCSGMLLRDNLFTATAPDDQGLLHIGLKKNGVCFQLSVV